MEPLTLILSGQKSANPRSARVPPASISESGQDAHAPVKDVSVPPAWIGKRARCPRSRQEAFSLVEILVVIAIMAVLVGLAMVPIRSVTNSYQLADYGQRLASLIEQARMHATTTQRVTLLRFISEPAGEDGAVQVTSVGLYEIVPSRTDPTAQPSTNPIARVLRLQEPVFISQEKSSAVHNSGMVSSGGADWPKEFYIYPDGSSSLAGESPNPHFTLLMRRDEDKLNNPVVVSLDPLTTRVTLFRK